MPDALEELALRDHPLAGSQQVNDQLQDAGLDVDRNLSASDLEAVLVDLELPPHESHHPPPGFAGSVSLSGFASWSTGSSPHALQQVAFLVIHVGEQVVDE